MSGQGKGPPKIVRAPEDLDDAQLAEFTKKLLAFVRRRAKWMFAWLGTKDDDLGLGRRCEDIVAECLASLFVKPQAWQPQSSIDLLSYLRSKANSHLINLKTLMRRRELAGEDFRRPTDGKRDKPDGTAGADNGDNAMAKAPSEEPAAYEVVSLKQLHDAIVEVILEEGDPQLIALYDIAFEDGELSPSACGTRLKMSARDVDNLKQKLRRRVLAALERLGLKLTPHLKLAVNEEPRS